MAGNDIFQGIIQALQGAGMGWLGDPMGAVKMQQQKQMLQMKLDEAQQEKEKNAIMAQYHKALIQRMEFEEKHKQKEIEKGEQPAMIPFTQKTPEMGVANAPMENEPSVSGGIFPTGKVTEETVLKPAPGGITWAKLKQLKEAGLPMDEWLGMKTKDEFASSPSGIFSKKTGTIKTPAPEKTVRGSDLKIVKDENSGTGWSYKNMANPNAPLEPNAPPPSQTVMSPFQEDTKRYRDDMLKYKEEFSSKLFELREKSLDLREELGRANLALRERLPAAKLTELSQDESKIDRYANLINEFQPDYGGKIFLGPLGTSIHARLGTDKDRVRWWKQFNMLDNELRHEVFGATLTGYEKKSWERVTVDENTDPETAIGAIQDRLQIAKNNLMRKREKLESGGYSENPSSSGKKDKKLIHYSSGNDEFYIPPEKEQSFLKAHPKAKRLSQ